MFHKIVLIEGSSVSIDVVDKVKSIIGNSRRIMVILDSNHTHEHVFKELQLYTPFISNKGYCIIFDTGIEDLTPDLIGDRPWGPGNSPKSAVFEFLKINKRFIIDKEIETQLLVTSAPDGYLKCIEN
jgi:cephalosporin hydroxylase